MHWTGNPKVAVSKPTGYALFFLLLFLPCHWYPVRLPQLKILGNSHSSFFFHREADERPFFTWQVGFHANLIWFWVIFNPRRIIDPGAEDETAILLVEGEIRDIKFARTGIDSGKFEFHNSAEGRLVIAGGGVAETDCLDRRSREKFGFPNSENSTAQR